MSSAIVVVGAGLGGARVVAELRSGGYDGDLILIGRESHHPYDRPPLSKAVLTGDAVKTELHSDTFYAEKNVDLRTGTRVASIDTDARTVDVELPDGGAEKLAYGTLVLATGLDARRLPVADGKAGVHTLRTYDDAVALREEALRSSAAVVVGAGFIGCEVAASLASMGLKVTIVESASAPLAFSLGERVGTMVGRILIDRGVEIRAGVGVAGIAGDPTVTAVTLSDGTTLPADIVVVGVGSNPVVDYLDGSGILLADAEDGGGIACDASGRTNVPGVFALGDVANWRDAYGTASRVEHWNSVVDQSATVARAILDTEYEPSHPVVPYFWSDQFDVKIQALGEPSPSHEVHVVLDDGAKFVAYYSRGGMLTAVVGAGKAGAIMKMRNKLQSPTPVSELVD
ncbi:NAD(P)/FAD-dependent oxidoreductase [Rhodococcus sp. NPDC058521]|uniref:NAD(P)/FAD-dependent oxidoreductase n=1 Tax=Rhodococcus sp. NPDC058521 TaxID=3346536 RepID=UPI00364E9BED